MGIIDDFGISTHIVRHVANDYDSAPKYLGNAIPLKLFFGLIKIILTVIILILFKRNELTITITIAFYNRNDI